MNFADNNAALDNLMNLFMNGFSNVDNPDAVFSGFNTPIEAFQQSPVLAKQALGDDAYDIVFGVIAGKVFEGNGGSVAVFTGNTKSAPLRADFIANLLQNWHGFYAWMKAYMDTRENGYMVVPHTEGKWLAVPPGFDMAEAGKRPFAVADSPSAAASLLFEREKNKALVESLETTDAGLKDFAWSLEWLYARSHPPENDAAIVPDELQELVITGIWHRPNTRKAVKTSRNVPLLTENDSPDMLEAKREIVADLYANHQREF